MAADDGVVRRTLGVLGLVAALTATTTAMLPAAWGQAPSASAVATFCAVFGAAGMRCGVNPLAHASKVHASRSFAIFGL